MWIPESVHALEAAARGGSLCETPSFDGKRQLPGPQKNVSLAIDVAAMSTDGGVLLYGVGEDANKRLTVLDPFPLAGAADRVAQIVETSITEPPHIEIYERPTEKDPNVGYLLVLVPQSARAPHQVTVKGDLRFYGRGAKGNRVLTEGEIARLYARRVVWEQDRNELLEDAVRQSRFPNSERSVIGFARPVCLIPLSGTVRWPRLATEMRCSESFRLPPVGPRPRPNTTRPSVGASSSGISSAAMTFGCRPSKSTNAPRTRPCMR